MKPYALVFVFLILYTVCYAQEDRQSNVMLLSQYSAIEKCGIMKFSEMMKFRLVEKCKNQPNDTVIFYVLCPADYDDNFWEANKTYHIHYQKNLSAAKKSSAIVDKLSKKDEKYKVLGVVITASKK